MTLTESKKEISGAQAFEKDVKFRAVLGSHQN